MLSATLADKIKLFKNFGYLMGFYDNPRKFPFWLKKLTAQLKTDESIALNKKLFPNYGGRMRIKDLGNMFPKNDIRANCYQMTNADKIAEQYKIIEDAYTDIKEKASTAIYILPKIIRARQAVELLKVPTFVQLIKENIVDGKSSVVFLNYNETLKTIADELDIDCVVHGEQSIEERNQNIRDFQANKKTIILLNHRAGSVGISLHDLLGSHQRVSIISPTWSAQDFIQSLGRIHRAGAKTDAIQKVVFCEGTIEEFICGTLKYKLEHLSKLNDGDFDTYKIEGINSGLKNNSDDESGDEDESPQEPIQTLLGDDKKKTQEAQDTKSLFNPMGSSEMSLSSVKAGSKTSKGKKKPQLTEIDL
jgi:superfamily II DNA/RNA helicase